MKLDAWPVEPPGFGIGPLSTRTRSRQPSRARWWTRLLPTMPAPMMTALARRGVSVINHPASRGWSIPVRSRAARRHCSACWSWLKVNRCSPATTRAGRGDGRGPRGRGAGPGCSRRARQNRRNQPGCPARNRADSAAPAIGRHPQQPGPLSGPASPTYSGSVTPRARIRWIHRPQHGRVEAQVADDVGWRACACPTWPGW